MIEREQYLPDDYAEEDDLEEEEREEEETLEPPESVEEALEVLARLEDGDQALLGEYFRNLPKEIRSQLLNPPTAPVAKEDTEEFFSPTYEEDHPRYDEAVRTGREVIRGALLDVERGRLKVDDELRSELLDLVSMTEALPVSSHPGAEIQAAAHRVERAQAIHKQRLRESAPARVSGRLERPTPDGGYEVVELLSNGTEGFARRYTKEEIREREDERDERNKPPDLNTLTVEQAANLSIEHWMTLRKENPAKAEAILREASRQALYRDGGSAA